MHGKLAQLRSLARKPLRDQGLWARALLLVIVVRLGLSWWSYRGLREHLPRWFRRGNARLSARQAESEARRIAWAVERAASLVPGATCLTQAFATQMLLCSRGEASLLRIGVARNAGSGAFEAHAWIEHRDRLLIGGPRGHVARYQPIATFGMEN